MVCLAVVYVQIDLFFLGVYDDVCGSVADHVQRQERHLNRTVDSYDKGVGDHAQIGGPAHTGEDGYDQGRPCDRDSRAAHSRADGEEGHNDQVGRCHVDARACGDEGHCEHVHNGGSVHVDGHTCRKHEAGDLAAAAQLLQVCLCVQGQGRRGGVCGKSKHAYLGDLLDKLEGVQPCCQPDTDGIDGHNQDEQGDHSSHDVGRRRRQVLSAVDGEGTGYQAEDSHRAHLVDEEGQVEVDDLASRLQHMLQGICLLFQHVHAKADDDGHYHNRQDAVVAAHGLDDVGRNGCHDGGQRVELVDGGRVCNRLGRQLYIEKSGCLHSVSHKSSKEGAHDVEADKAKDCAPRDPSQLGGAGDTAHGKAQGAEHQRYDGRLQAPHKELSDDVEKTKRRGCPMCLHFRSPA